MNLRSIFSSSLKFLWIIKTFLIPLKELVKSFGDAEKLNALLLKE